MKAILELNEMPDNCEDCPISYEYYGMSGTHYICSATQATVTRCKDRRHSDCPLKEKDESSVKAIL
jgi:hypothetical protein